MYTTLMRIYGTLVLLCLNSFVQTSFAQMQRAIHMGGNWCENWLRGIAQQPEDYYAFLRSVSVNWAGITVGLRLEHSMDSTVERDYSEGLTVPTFRDQPLMDAIRGFKSRNIKVMLSLALESEAAQHSLYPFQRWQLGDPKAYQTDPNIRPENWPWDPAHPKHNSFVSTFWRTYAQEAAYFARIAQAENVDMFAIGAETDRLFRTRLGGQFSNEFKDYIKAVVGSVKKYYTGVLTYEQHWSALIDQIGFGPAIDNIWEDVGLNAIGISAYFRLVNSEPSRVLTVAELEAAWNNIFNDHLKPLRNRHPSFPIYFLEFGYVDVIPSIYNADSDVFKPYVFKDNNGNGLDDGQEQQANAYDSFFSVNESNSRLVQSTFMWDIQIASDINWANGFGKLRIHSFRGKLSENVIKNWYARFTPLPSIPTLISPSNNAQNVPLAGLILDWSDANEAAQYHLQLARDSNFLNLTIDMQNILQSNYSYAQDLPPNSFYWWRVKSKNASGESEWSSTFSFKTIKVLPSVPQLIEPQNDAVNVSVSPKLKWRSSMYAEQYSIEVSTKSDFSSIYYSNTSITDTSVILMNLQNGEKYYWHVQAINSAGTSIWSEVWEFTTIVSIPVVPILTSPSSGSSNISINPVLSWSASTGANTYRLQVASDSLFNSIVFSDSTLTTTSRQIGPLLNNTKYYWRVNAKNIAGTSAWSTIWNFTTLTTNVEKEDNLIPTEYNLAQNYPNPFNPSTTIQFDIPQSGLVTLKIYNTLGKEIAKLLGFELSTGRYTVKWIANQVPSGVYFVRLQINNFDQIRKIILMK